MINALGCCFIGSIGYPLRKLMGVDPVGLMEWQSNDNGHACVLNTVAFKSHIFDVSSVYLFPEVF